MPPCLALGTIRIKGKVEQIKEWSGTLPLHLSVEANEKGAFGSSSTKVANFTYYDWILQKIKETLKKWHKKCKYEGTKNKIP